MEQTRTTLFKSKKSALTGEPIPRYAAVEKCAGTDQDGTYVVLYFTPEEWEQKRNECERIINQHQIV